MYEHARPSTYSALCTLLIQLEDGMDTYAEDFIALHTRVAHTRRLISHVSEAIWCTTLPGVRHIPSVAAPRDGLHGAVNMTGAGHVGSLGASCVAMLWRPPALLPPVLAV